MFLGFMVGLAIAAGPAQAGDPRVQAILDGVSAAQLRAEVDALTTIESRATQARGNIEATNLLLARFQALGYAPTRQCFASTAHGETCNVLARKAAVATTDDTVVVMGHFDSVGHSRAGADDNASGTAGVLEIARALLNVPLRTNVVFVASNAEEKGLIGSKYFVAELQRLNQLRFVKLAVVMDMIGYNTGRVDVETNEPHKVIGQNLVDDIGNYVAALPARLIMPGWGSDHVSFLSKGVPSFLVIDDTNVNTPCYHKACDQLETIDFDYHRKLVQVSLLATLRAAL